LISKLQLIDCQSITNTITITNYNQLQLFGYQVGEVLLDLLRWQTAHQVESAVKLLVSLQRRKIIPVN
jgi:hypothetical protein